MRKLSDSLMERHLKQAIEQLMPPTGQAEQLWERPVEKASGNEWYLAGTNSTHHSHGGFLWAVSAAACLALICSISYYAAFLRLDATVYLDVNPSVELRLNQREEVLSVRASNLDGAGILDGIELKHMDVDTAVNAILSSMLSHGYLGRERDVLLLSVDSANSKRAKELQSRLASDISEQLGRLNGSSIVLSQTIRTDHDLQTLASAHGMTPGKAALLGELTKADPALNYEEIAAMSMDELMMELERRGISIQDFVNCVGMSPGENSEISPNTASDGPGENDTSDVGNGFDKDNTPGGVSSSDEDDTSGEGNNSDEDDTSGEDNDADEDDTPGEDNDADEDDTPGEDNGADEDDTPGENNGADEDDIPGESNDADEDDTPDEDNDADEDDTSGEDNDTDEDDTPDADDDPDEDDY